MQKINCILSRVPAQSCTKPLMGEVQPQKNPKKPNITRESRFGFYWVFLYIGTQELQLSFQKLEICPY